jgi:hypothetical protein
MKLAMVRPGEKKTTSRAFSIKQGPPEDRPAEKGPTPGSPTGSNGPTSFGLKLSTCHHVANRGRVPLSAARRIDPARVQGLGDLPQ